MTEKDQFIEAWTREYAITLKLLRAYPGGKDEFRPAEKSRNARELAWIFLAEEKVLEAISVGDLPFTQAPAGAGRAGERDHQDVREVAPGGARQGARPCRPRDWIRPSSSRSDPKQMADVRVGQVFWMMLMDSIHHRGQLSVYLRLLGARVPSIYGPTADEPWM